MGSCISKKNRSHSHHKPLLLPLNLSDEFVSVPDIDIDTLLSRRSSSAASNPRLSLDLDMEIKNLDEANRRRRRIKNLDEANRRRRRAVSKSPMRIKSTPSKMVSTNSFTGGSSPGLHPRRRSPLVEIDSNAIVPQVSYSV